jgi:hypothetical protein
MHHSALSSNRGLAGFDTWNPDHVLSTHHYRPSRPQWSGDPCIGKEAFYATATTIQVSCEAITRTPLPYNEFCCLWDVNSPGITGRGFADTNTSGWLCQETETAEPCFARWAKAERGRRGLRDADDRQFPSTPHGLESTRDLTARPWGSPYDVCKPYQPASIEGDSGTGQNGRKEQPQGLVGQVSQGRRVQEQ